MTNNDQTDALMFDLDNLIRRYQQEYDLNDQTIVGVLEFAKLTVLTDAEIIFSPEDLDEDDDLDDYISPQFWTATGSVLKSGRKIWTAYAIYAIVVTPRATPRFLLSRGGICAIH